MCDPNGPITLPFSLDQSACLPYLHSRFGHLQLAEFRIQLEELRDRLHNNSTPFPHRVSVRYCGGSTGQEGGGKGREGHAEQEPSRLGNHASALQCVIC